MKLIPSWVYWMVIGVLTLGLGAQQLRVMDAKLQHAHEVSSRAIENTERMGVALKYETRLSTREREHAKEQQDKDSKYAKDILALKSSNTLRAADNERLRKQLDTFSSGSNKAGESDADFCQRARNRLPFIGQLLGEAQGLLGEGQGIIEQRAVEIDRLKDQITNDRKACTTE